MSVSARPLAGDMVVARERFEALFALILLAVLLVSTVDDGDLAAVSRGLVLVGFLLLVVLNLGAALAVYIGAVVLFSVHHYFGQGSYVQRPDNYMFLALCGYAFLGRCIRSPGRFGRSAILAGALVALSLVQLVRIVGMSPYEISWYARSIVMPFAVCFLLRRAALSGHEVRALLLAIAVIGVYHAIVSILEIFDLYQLILPPWIGDPQFNPAFDDSRAGGLPMQPEWNAIDVSLGLTVILLLFELSRSRARAGWIPGAAICLLAVYLTYTRAAWLGLLIGAAPIFWKASGDRGVTLKRRALFVGGTLGFACLLLFLPSDLLRGRTADTGTVYFRFSIWLSGLDIIRQYPLLGIGFGQFSLYLPDYLQPVEWIPETDMPREGTLAHNTTLSMAAEFGLVGLALYLGTLYGLYRAARRSAGAAWGALGQHWITAYFLVYLVNIQFITAHKLTSNILFFGVVGVVAGMRVRPVAGDPGVPPRATIPAARPGRRPGPGR